VSDHRECEAAIHERVGIDGRHRRMQEKTASATTAMTTPPGSPRHCRRRMTSIVPRCETSDHRHRVRPRGARSRYASSCSVDGRSGCPPTSRHYQQLRLHSLPGTSSQEMSTRWAKKVGLETTASPARCVRATKHRSASSDSPMCVYRSSRPRSRASSAIHCSTAEGARPVSAVPSKVTWVRFVRRWLRRTTFDRGSRRKRRDR
jgi:hypothetical protein